MFLPAMKQLANVAALPGIVKASLGMPGLLPNEKVFIPHDIAYII